ncbi:reverse transcriptase [Gossypium australe]|uniref:Reverse transcriptase n=1 Tax=Gossypium australe TaxID=47621 RepID=A0A5B6WH63_9ROSI|nr:reverse transcriptase [Gossypium australe]
MDHEIKEAFNQMGPRKAPGIDGLSGNVECLNDIIIVLIPKIKELMDMTNFRPISLCRVVYKIVAKVLANHLKETLLLCISQNQSAFVPRRMIHDNILIAHEMFYYLQSVKNGPNKGFVIKLDMSKAYVRVEWAFIEGVMEKMGYTDDWVMKIMRCVRSVRYVVKCNSILSETIVPERGLRQGDPLSPYLFLFCMESFSKLLTRAQNNNMIKGIRASINGPHINHLFFADDALLFIRNKKRDVEEIVSIFENFSRDSGQEINKDKSMIMFNPKTPVASRHLFSSILGMRNVDKLDSYLGLPLPVGRKKSVAFTNIINRCTCIVRGWSKQLLSYGGKEVFIKAIMQAIPTYAFLVFLAPKGSIKELHSQMGRMWWNNNDKARGWTMMAWDRMCYPKGVGDMGFRDVHLFNLALLGRQVWRLMIQKDTMCYKVLSAKYFPNGDVFSYKRCDKPSFTWMSIARAVDALKDGFMWQVGDGNTIDIRRDHWGVEGNIGESVCRSLFTNNERKVKDLWDHVNKRWKMERIVEIYGEDMGDCICNLPIFHNGIKDTRTWLQNSHVVYTSKSAYSWMILKRVDFGPHRLYWRSIWKLKMLLKIKIFSWQIGHNILPTYDNIARIRQGFNNICPRCKSREETLIHALKDCPKAQDILVADGLNNRLLEGEYNECIDWLEDVFRELGNKAAADLLSLLWNSWNDRNNMIFKEKMDAAVVIWERSQILSKDFRIFNLIKPSVISQTPTNKGWTKPLMGYVKVNVDAAVSNGCSGFRAVATN